MHGQCARGRAGTYATSEFSAPSELIGWMYYSLAVGAGCQEVFYKYDNKCENRITSLTLTSSISYEGEVVLKCLAVESLYLPAISAVATSNMTLSMSMRAHTHTHTHTIITSKSITHAH